MGKLKGKRLSGSTLIEVLIAMVIIMVVFSIAMGLFSNVLRSGVSMRKVRVNQQLELLRQQAIKNGKIESGHQLIDSIDYECSTLKQVNGGMDILEIKATDNGAQAGSIRFLLKKSNENATD
ncbi:hypothetical protein DBR40_01050 [Pedobacter sp. KBW01]|uniref:PulJ/GspJ family protein n=1 Tax=Pedobacter sp. KBW01 TaxID=2153364 RepID=UPI000F58F890|nr:type II secretion system protein [Pedobacter sp. KBW01]RQO80235.1 hypothetical protein DBR40_01050 [Pedobacter sp. KBW01]